MKTKQVILTHSFKGGTGKTVIATNFAYYFSKQGYKTLLIDGDLSAPSLFKVFPRGEEIEKLKTWTEHLSGVFEHVEDVIYPTGYPNLDVIYSPPPEIGKDFLQDKSSEWWVNSMKTALQTRSVLLEDLGYDFVVLDNQNGISMNSTNNLALSDISFLVLRPVTYGISGTIHILREMYATLADMKKRNDYLIWNQVPKTSENATNTRVNFIIDTWDDFFKRGGLEGVARIDYNANFSISMLEQQSGVLLGTSEYMQSVVEGICQKIGLT